MKDFIVSERISAFISARAFKPDKLTKAELLQLLSDVRLYARRLDAEEINPMLAELEGFRAKANVAAEPKKAGRPRRNSVPGALVRKDNREGMSLRQLASKYNLSVNTIRAILAEDASHDEEFLDTFGDVLN